jgi:hypothetical protein
MNHVLHVAAIVQLRNDTEGRAYYRRKRAAKKTPMEALRCLKRRLSDVIYRQLLADAQAAELPDEARAREGTAGRLKNPARSTYPRTSTLRISHFPDPQNRRYSHPSPARTPRGLGSRPSALARRSRQGGAPNRTNDLDGDKRRCTLKGDETPRPLT